MSEFIETLAEIEREHIKKALRVCGWNMTKAAKILGIARSTLYLKMKVYEIEYGS